ncbi:MAG: gliding motility-associated C-terminal domain-containing protein [Cryomorphaceae bacterium]|nr:gliding motility-associated C-terminal domain-containing protein [Cryomorphaceae bacterium]
MKRFFLLFALPVLTLFLGQPQQADAAHLIGGELTYKYIGDSTNIPHHYRIDLVLHRTTRWTTLNLGASYQVCIRSSCHPNQTITVSYPQGFPSTGEPVPGQDECVESASQDFTPVFQHLYTGTVILGGTCADYKFSHAMICCRIGIGNIVNYSANGGGGSTNYLEATLNNTQGENTSPQFVAPPAKSFCVSNFFTWSQASWEPDNDSIEYEFGTAMNGPCNGPGQNMIFAAGYSQPDPLGPAVTGLTINTTLGIFEFTTTTITGNFIVVIVVKELRLHPNGNFYYEVGSVMREMLINIVGTCLQATANGPRFDLSIPGIYMDDTISTGVLGIIGNNYPHPNADSVPNANSPTGYVMEWPVIEYDCFDSVITLEFETNVQCMSITESGSEFRLVGPDSNLVPITFVDRNCNLALETKIVHLYLHQPLAKEGDHYMYIKEGTDGNTILNSCGFPMDEFFALIIRVIDCPDPLYDIKNVSVVNNDHIQIFWEPDSTSFPTHATSGWYFFRSDDGGGTFNRVGSIRGQNAPTARNWIDYGVSNDDVNSQTYQYQVQMEVSGNFYQFTRDITSIYLKRGPGWGNYNNFQWNLEWNDYDGWVAPEYHLMIWDIDSTGLWTPVNQPTNTTTNTTITFDYEQVAGRMGDNFALRIDAKDPNFSGIDYTAKSNYVYLKIPTTPPPPIIDTVALDDLVIPNVFTPNGDGKNDVFYIKGIEGFRSAEVIFTNRWGNVVYRNSNFQRDNAWDGRDQTTGQMVSDGVYFYIIRLRGSIMGFPDVEETGSISIFGSGSR